MVMVIKITKKHNHQYTTDAFSSAVHVLYRQREHDQVVLQETALILHTIQVIFVQYQIQLSSQTPTSLQLLLNYPLLILRRLLNRNLKQCHFHQIVIDHRHRVTIGYVTFSYNILSIN
jgi:hypothetical protein